MPKQHSMRKTQYFLTFVSVALLIVAVVLTLYRAFARTDEPAENRIEIPLEVRERVLFLSSYTPLYFSYEEQALGLKEGLYPEGIEYDVVYMDSKNYGQDKDFEDFHDFLAARLSDGMRYSAVILGDDDALKFALNYHDELFPGLPMVFFGINDYSLADEASRKPDFTGFTEKDFLRPTIDTAIALLPNTDKLVAIHDETAAGTADRKMFFSLMWQYPDYQFSEIDTSKLTQDEFIEALEAITDDTIVIYMTCYSDASRINYSVQSRTATIVEHTNVPVFRNYSGGEDQGILGGTYMDFEAQGRMVGETVVKVLNGADISKIKLNTATPSKTTYSYPAMEHFGLDFSFLPEDTVFVDKPETFLERYGRILPGISLIALALVLLVIASNLSAATSRRENEALLQTQKELEESQAEMKYQLEHDLFLDILNRATVRERLKDSLSPSDVFSVLMIDIDDFKGVNESYGHVLADRILLDLTGNLRFMAVEHGWTLGRYGGDQFLIMVPGARLTESDPIVHSLLELFRRPIPIDDEMIILSASIGIAVSDGETLPEQCITNSETAMYEAKKRGSNIAFLYADEMKRKVREENQIKAKILDAFEHDGFYMVYQPQINSETLKVSGYEALVRMKEPGLYPGQFIPIIEKSGWIARLGRITTELAIKQLASWRDNGHELHPVSVNFSSNQLNDSGYFDFVRDLLMNYEIPAKYLEIEITEGLFIERSAHAEELFTKFKELGIRLLMDDFGTGYSSLGYLTYIPVDVIKLDKSLVDTYLVDGKDNFIRDVINLVHDLEKEVIIEGVEEEWQFKRLCEFHADTIQGYYFSKPISADEAIEFSL